MNITDITNAALLDLHRESIELREAAFQSGVPAWSRDQQSARHDEIVREMVRRGLLRREIAFQKRHASIDCAVAGAALGTASRAAPVSIPPQPGGF